MNENIIQVSLNEMRVKGILYQYDTGQKIQFDEDVAVGTHVLFSNSDIQKSKRKVVENNMVDVPNEVLKTSGTLTIDVQIVNENAETTLKTVKILVRDRKEAEDVVTPENEQTFIEQIQSIMTETKTIALSAEEKATNVENRANGGKFNGKDGKDGEPGPQGPVGPPGDDYVLTDEDKEEIADEVVNEIQPTLDEIMQQSKDYTDTEITGLKNELAEKDTSYRLIQKIKLAEDVSSVVVSKDNANNPFSYNKVKIIIPKLYVSATGAIFIYMFDKNEKQFNFAAVTNIENDSLTRFDIPIINSDFLWYEAITRRGSATPVITSLTRDSMTETDGYVTKISINCLFAAGSEIYVYGGNEQ